MNHAISWSWDFAAFQGTRTALGKAEVRILSSESKSWHTIN